MRLSTRSLCSALLLSILVAPAASPQDKPSGSTTATNLKIEAEVLSYLALDAAAATLASEIAEALQTEKPKHVLITDRKTVELVMAYRAWEREVDTFIQKAHESLQRSPQARESRNMDAAKEMSRGAATAVPAAFGMVNTALEILELFKIDEALSGTAVSLDPMAIEASIAEALRKEGVTVVTTRSYFPDFSNSPYLKVVEKLKSLSKEAEVEAPGASTVADATNRLLASIDPGAATGAEVPGALLVASDLSELFKKGMVLTLTQPIAGATQNVRRNLLVSRLTFSGGAIVGYTLTVLDGTVVKSGVVKGFAGPCNVKAIAEQVHQRSAVKKLR